MNIPKNFILVDDDRANNFLCNMIIKKVIENAAITSFVVPENALEYIKENFENSEISEPVVLFLDLNMPSISGWEFLDEFKNFPGHIHKQFTIYMLTSSVDQNDRDIAEENVFVSGFISKPLKKDMVVELFLK